MDNRSELDKVGNGAQHDESMRCSTNTRIDDCEGVAMNTKTTRILLGTIVFLLVTALCWGQGSTAAITGQVTDQSGAAIPSAAIQAKDLDRGTTWQTLSHAAG